MRSRRYHLIVDISRCGGGGGRKLQMILEECIRAVAAAIDMRIIAGPVIKAGTRTNPGFSAFAIIDYSHISIHTFSNYSEVLIDIFSCREYDQRKVIEVCKKFFAKTQSRIRRKVVWWG